MRSAVAACALLGALHSPSAHAADPAFVGSVGVPDEGCNGAAVFNGATASLRAGAIGTCTLRYMLPPMDPQVLQLTALLRDTGDAARVRVRVRQLAPNTGAATTLATLDSDTKPGSTDWQRRQTTCWSTAGGNSYWVEVDLTRLRRAGDPALQWFGVQFSACDEQIE